MNKCKYTKEHNNYDLTLGKIYDFRRYISEWTLIMKDDKGNKVLYRTECFEFNSGRS